LGEGSRSPGGKKRKTFEERGNWCTKEEKRGSAFGRTEGGKSFVLFLMQRGGTGKEKRGPEKGKNSRPKEKGFVARKGLQVIGSNLSSEGGGGSWPE